MPYATGVGLNQSYSIMVRLDLDNTGLAQRVYHQDLEWEFPIVSHHSVRKELIFKHPTTRRLYTLKYRS